MPSGPMRLRLGGYFSAYGVFLEQSHDPGEVGASRHRFDIKREAEIFFLGEAKLDNGLQIGVDAQLEAEGCADQIDESYIWFQGGWGRLILGSENSAAYLLTNSPPIVDGNFDSLDPSYRLWNGVAGDLRVPATGIASTIDQPVMLISGDAEKATYLSPRIAGFRAGLSYTPDNSEEGTSASGKPKGGAAAGMPRADDVGEWGNIIELGLNYDNQFGPVSFLANAGWGRGVREADNAADAFKDRQLWQAGATIGFAGAKLGAVYFQDDNGLKTRGTQRSWQAGLTYSIGRTTLGVSYLDSVRERASAVGVAIADESLKRVFVGARYALGPGVELRGSLQYYDYDAGTRASTNEVWGAVFGTVFTF
jgi:outer membrane protein OmpU